MSGSGVPGTLEFEGPVTILFTDVEGSTELRTRLGDEASQDILRSCDRVIRSQVEAAGGREIKSLGDGLMVAFTSAKKAVGCAVAIQRAVQDETSAGTDGHLRVRIGLNTGEVIAEEGDLHGEAIHAAARVAARARGGEILTTGVVRELAGTVPDVTFRDRGRVRLRGFPDRRQIYEVVWRTDEAPVTVLGRTPYVGREAEKAELLRLMEKAVAGQGAVVMIGGEPGVGKTRLAEEILAEAAKRGMLGLVGHCYETESAPPYVAFVEILESAARGAARSEALREALGDVAGEIARIVPELRRLFPDIPPPLELPPEQERRYLFNSIAEFLQRAGALRPQLLLLDDLHWADEPTLLLLEHLSERVHELPVLIVGTYRDVELDTARPLANALERLVRRRLAHRISLRRLPQEEVAQMLKALAKTEAPDPLVQALYDETEGNPFFVEEVYKYLSEEGKLFDEKGLWRSELNIDELEVPEGVRLVIGRRLERLSESARRVLAAAAVIGRAFTYDLLRESADIDEDTLLDALDDAERAYLVTSSDASDDDRLLFAHELIRQTLLGSVSAPRRRKLHANVADAMERIYKDSLEENAADIASHLGQAGSAVDPQRTIRYLQLAADRALSVAAFEDGQRYCEDALTLEPKDDLEKAELLFRLGLAQRSLGRVDEALSAWREALEIFVNVADPERVGEVCFDMAQQFAWASRWPEALEIAARGLQVLGDRVSTPRARLYGISGVVLAHSGQYDAAVALINEGQATAQKVGDPLLLAYEQLSRALIHQVFLELDKAVSVGMPAVPALRNAGALWDLCSFLGFMQFAFFFLGRWEEANAVAAELEPMARRIGHYGALVFAREARPIPEFIKTDLAGMQAIIEEDSKLAEQVGALQQSQMTQWRGVIEMWRGDLEAAEEWFQAALDLEAPGIWSQPPWGHLFLNWCYRGERERALKEFEAHSHLLPEAGRPNHWGGAHILSCAVEGFWILGERKRAAELQPLVVEVLLGKGIGRNWDLRLHEITAGIGAAAGESWDEAEKYFEAGLAKADELGLTVQQADGRRFFAEMLLERGREGDSSRAADLLEEALGVYRDIGMRRHVELVETLRAR
ncbi:MAG TPA: AAA family ATPase [Actinomycetota bacterium]|nr:AAA family ATPase [Actinomycetota bacterium]